MACGLLVGQGLLEAVDRGAEDVLLLEPGDPVVGGVGGDALAEDRLQLRLVLELLLEGGELGPQREVLVEVQRLGDARSGFCLKAPTMQTAPSLVWNTPDSGMAPS